MDRRAFSRKLAAMGFLAGGSTTLGGELERLAADLGRATEPRAYWSRLRKEFLLHPGLVHLNTGTLGAVPRLVLDAVSAWLYQLEGDPVNTVFGPLGARMEEVRAKAAEFLGASLNEVALTRNTTEGMNAVASSLTLEPGDEILSTNHEHAGGTVCWEHLVKHRGAKLVALKMPAPVRDEAEILQLVEDHITPRTRVCSFSHVETITGMRMPLAKIAEITRPKGILLVCDGAQAPGMLDARVKELGVDTYASSSHKWLLAPKGCGLLYIRKDVQDRVRPILLDGGYNAYTGSNGTRDVAGILGHGAAIDFHNTIGRARIEARCLELNGRLRSRLEEHADLFSILTPARPELASGIVSISLKRGKASEVVDRLLRDHEIVVKLAAKPEYNALRLSTHLYNNEREIDRFVEVLVGMLKA